MRRMFFRGRMLLLAAISGGSVFVLGGCDPNVRDTVLSGVEGATTTLTTTFINAFFQTVLAPKDEGPATTVRVMHDLPEPYFG